MFIRFCDIARAFPCALLVVELFVLGAQPATAAPIQCDTVTTLEQLIALDSSGCKESAYGVRLYDFSYVIAGTAGADEVAAADVWFTRGGTRSALILDFGEWTVQSGQTLAVTIGYSFAGGRLLSAGQFMSAEPWYAPLDGAARLMTTLCLGDVFPCVGGTLVDLAAAISIGGTKFGSAEMSLLLDGRLLGDQPITVHSAATVFGVPEPPFWALLGSALVPCLLRRRSRSN